MYPDNYKYIQEHMWTKVINGIATVGITSYITEKFGEFLYCELPEKGIDIEQLQEIGSLETSKEVFTLHAPLSGEVIRINDDINEANMEPLNDSPYEEGWLFQIKISDEEEIDDLITSEEYENYLESINYDIEKEEEIDLL